MREVTRRIANSHGYSDSLGILAPRLAVADTYTARGVPGVDVERVYLGNGVRALEARITDRTRAVVIINPNNPTGAVYSRRLLHEIAAVARRHRVVLVVPGSSLGWPAPDHVRMTMLAQVTELGQAVARLRSHLDGLRRAAAH